MKDPNWALRVDWASVEAYWERLKAEFRAESAEMHRRYAAEFGKTGRKVAPAQRTAEVE